MYKTKLVLSVFLPLVILILTNNVSTVHAQLPGLDQIDFRRIRVDEMSDDQIRQFMLRVKSSGLSQQQLESQALSRGMPQSEILKLRERVAVLEQETEDQSEMQPESGRQITDEQMLSQKEMPEEEVPDTIFRVFGYDLFKREGLSFEPSLSIPTPKNYQLGPGDELIIEIWGASQRSYQLIVNPEGQIRIDNLGLIHVSGLTIEKASELLISRLSTIYSGLRRPDPNTFAQISLSMIRSIKVTIAGDVYLPGTFTLPAFATIFNALYLAGGPSERGSFRNIKVFREGEGISSIDLYDFLIRGETLLNIRLRDEDLIFIEPYYNRISMSGYVKRPAIYELKENETMADLILYTGGFTSEAYQKRLQVNRKTESQRRLINLESEHFQSFIMKDGDEINVGSILDIFENRVSIQGAVFREGDYALTEGMTIKDLIFLAEGLREDVFLNRAALYRLQENKELEVIDLNLEGILDGTAGNLKLRKEDLLVISSVLDLQQERTVRIMGEIKTPGTYPYAHNLTLGEVIRQSGGLNDAASLARIEVARRIQNRDAISPTERITEVFSFPLDYKLSLNDQASSFMLSPFDLIFVRRSPGYETQKLIQIRGEVAFPGSYAIVRNNERVSDLVYRAGGVTPDAYLPGATLMRQPDESKAEILRHLETLEARDLKVVIDTTETMEQYIGIDLDAILKQPYAYFDLILKEGDVLYIPQHLQTVKLTGSLLYPSTTPFQKGAGLRAYVSQAGGFADNARKSKVYVIYANGSVDKTNKFLGIPFYPTVEPGAEIIVPQKLQREPRTMQETIAISSAVTSLALIIMTLIRQF